MYLAVWITCAIIVLFLLLAIFIRALLLRIEIDTLNKRSVFITGCDSGFGNLVARSLDAKGIKVFAGCLTEQGALALRTETSSRLKTILIDITNEESVKKAFEFVKANLDENGLWGVVNNAGIMPTYSPAEWLSVKEFENCCKVNLFGTISVSLTFLPLLRKSRGRLVTVCSVTSDCAIPGISNYVISKAGTKMFSLCLRRELYGSGLTTHTIEPGGFATNITDSQRLQNIYRRAYHMATPEVREFYGGNISKYVFEGLKTSQKYISTKPEKVVNSIMHALLAKFPKERYLVGMDANFFFRLMGFLPVCIVDHIFGYPAPYGQKYDELEKEVEYR